MVGVVAVGLTAAGPVFAFDIADCTRTTHPSHGGEMDHKDVGAEWVSWTEWWSQEGVYSDLKVADCTAQRLLTARLREENVGDRRYDRRRAGQAAFERYTGRSTAFYRLDDLADALDRVAGGVKIEAMSGEVCACAALHPQARGSLEPFALR